MIDWQFRTIIVPDAIVGQLRQLTDAFGPAAQGMFTTPLSPTGKAPATHWISTGCIDAPFAAALPLTTYGTDEYGNEIATTAVPSYEAFVELCEAFGVPPLDVETFVVLSDAVIVTADGPQETMGRLGLRLVNPEEPNALAG